MVVCFQFYGVVSGERKRNKGREREREGEGEGEREKVSGAQHGQVTSSTEMTC